MQLSAQFAVLRAHFAACSACGGGDIRLTNVEEIDPSPARADEDTQTARERELLAKELKGEKSLTYLEDKI
jgi:hypothetical protein